MQINYSPCFRLYKRIFYVFETFIFWLKNLIDILSFYSIQVIFKIYPE